MTLRCNHWQEMPSGPREQEIRLLIGCPLCGRRLVVHQGEQACLRQGITNYASLGPRVTPLCFECLFHQVSGPQGTEKLLEALK